MQIKVCGVKTAEAIESAIQNDIDFVGFVFYSPSPRCMTPEKAKELIAQFKGEINFVALLVNPSDDDLDIVLNNGPYDYLQLHGCETPERIAEIKDKYGLPIIKAFPIESRKSLQTVPLYFKSVEWFLFDAKPGPNINKMPGGLGRTFDWSILEGYESPRPWMLAGGLNKDNIGHALSILKPHAVDLSSGLESAPGIKSPEKIEEFANYISSADFEDSLFG